MNCHAWSHERFQQSFRRNDATTTKRTAALKLNEMHADSSVAFAVYEERSGNCLCCSGFGLMGKSSLISWTDNTRLKINKRREVHLQSLLLFLRFESIVSLSTTGCRRRLDIAQCSDTGRHEKSLKKNLTQDTREREANNSRKMTIAQIVDTEKPPPPPHHRVVCAMWNLLNLAQNCCCWSTTNDEATHSLSLR